MRLRRLKAEFQDSLCIEWKSFLLRPTPIEGRDLERFRAYTQSWMRPAADGDGGTFRVWEGNAGPPTHSVPPHLVAKAAATLGENAFEAIHERLLHGYFAENRDITNTATLLAIWREAGLPEEDFSRREDPALLRAVFREHEEAIEHGVSGVPAVRIGGNPVPVVGAHPFEVYRRWVSRAIEERTREVNS